MGLCHGKPNQTLENRLENTDSITETEPTTLKYSTGKSSNFPYYSPSPFHNSTAYKNSPANSSVGSTPLRIFKRSFAPPSPAKHIRSLLARRHGSVKPNEASIPEGNELEVGLDKNFGYSKQLLSHYELGEEVGRGHFGYTCVAKGKKGSMKGHEVAVKVIPKSKMTTVIAIEDARREVKILKALTGHDNLVQFYDAYEDEDNVYIVMELCKGGELLDRILARGGKYSEEDAKAVMVQILRITAYCHLQGVVHRDLKPESGIFRAVLKADPNFDEAPWPSLSTEAVDFVKRLLNKDYRKRLTASQALSHPWLASYHEERVPLDMIIYKTVKSYICSSPLRKAALGAVAKTLTITELGYLRDQFMSLGPNKSGLISMQNFKSALMKNCTDAVKDSRVLDFVHMVSSLQYKKMDFEEFGATAISIHQLEAMDNWEQLARRAYDLFEKDGNRPIMIEELASELGLSPSIPVHVVLQDWIRHADGKLSFLGFVRLLHGASSRAFQKA
ncbi:hypothetical protein M8C21_029386 [Ambrosia artemisiifolia]|uniref:non-specific serine/threonine protein kinase n=1 Tax=Ambrosia artemisiifolia TaxID=4212 RepID=A0AAD5CD91_AMBAR|nr:hypothetical protein M8C21_029386 [Ambrosia artemisiifolia]